MNTDQNDFGLPTDDDTQSRSSDSDNDNQGSRNVLHNQDPKPVTGHVDGTTGDVIGEHTSQGGSDAKGSDPSDGATAENGDSGKYSDAKCSDQSDRGTAEYGDSGKDDDSNVGATSVITAFEDNLVRPTVRDQGNEVLATTYETLEINVHSGNDDEEESYFPDCNEVSNAMIVPNIKSDNNFDGISNSDKGSRQTTSAQEETRARQGVDNVDQRKTDSMLLLDNSSPRQITGSPDISLCVPQNNDSISNDKDGEIDGFRNRVTIETVDTPRTEQPITSDDLETMVAINDVTTGEPTKEHDNVHLIESSHSLVHALDNNTDSVTPQNNLDGEDVENTDSTTGVTPNELCFTPNTTAALISDHEIDGGGGGASKEESDHGNDGDGEGVDHNRLASLERVSKQTFYSFVVCSYCLLNLSVCLFVKILQIKF